MRGSEDMHSEFCTRVEEWIPVREETIQKIEGIIYDLKKHHRNVNISRITGSGVSIAGSLIAITGFGLAPVTLGASIGLTAGGIAMAVAGGTTVAGASIADTIIQKSNVKQAQEQLKEDYDQLYTIQVIAKIIDSNIVAASEERKECQGVGKRRVVGEVLAQGFLRASTVGVRTAEMAVSNTLEIGASALRIGGTAAKSVAAIGLVLNVVLIPIDLIEIVRSSVSLAKGSRTKAAKQLDEIVEQLKQQLRELKSAIYEQAQNGERDQAGTGSGTGPGTESGAGPGTGPTETGTETGIETPGTGIGTGPGTGTPGMGTGLGTETEMEPVVGSRTETEIGPGTVQVE